MKALHLENFRCFEKFEISFKPCINLIIGDNGSGKTSLLSACRYAISAFFAGFSARETSWRTFVIEDFREQIVNGLLLPEKPIQLAFEMSDTFSDNDFPSDAPPLLERKTKKNSRVLRNGLKPYIEYCKTLYTQSFDTTEQRQARPLPLFAAFSTEDIHRVRKINGREFKRYALAPTFGYYECLEGDGFFPYWIQRLLVLKEGEKNEEELSIVQNALLRALGVDGCRIFREISIRPIQKQVYFLTTDGREIAASHLPDGYRRLINIVMDLAFRCALLNRNLYRQNTCQETRGIVLIDEVDMHLNPSLQLRILQALQDTFPKLQFIVTTHAPLVMSGVENNENNQVLKLAFTPSNGYTIENIFTFGLDASTITEHVLEQRPRTPKVDYLLEQLFQSIDQKEVSQAHSQLNILRERFQENLPELAKAETMLYFLEDAAK